ncbi:DUF551 domain-containing protein [Enterobacter ludwigii]
MSTITKEQAKDLRNAFHCWQQDYDPVEDKEQYDMFGLGMVAMDALLASLEAEPVAYSLIFRNMEGVLNDYVNANTTFSTIEKAQAYGRGGNYVEQNDGSLQWVSDPSLDPVVVPLYTAPPAPVSVPDEMEMDDDFDSAFEHGKAVGWNAYRAAMLQSFGNSEQLNSPVIPDGWVACSEQMPEDGQEVIVQNKMGYRYVSYFDEHSGLFFDMRGGNQMNYIEHIFVTHWMPLPAAPQQEA